MASKSRSNGLGWPAAVAAGLILAAPSTQADVPGAVNWARSQGCARPTHVALHEDARLNDAADRMAVGRSLRAALSDVGYLASHSTAVMVSGGVSADKLAELLAKQDCVELTEADLSEMGWKVRDRDIWIVLATPVTLPSSSDAVLIRRQILELVNIARAAGRRCGNKSYPPAKPLELNDDLTLAALVHSQEMAAYNALEHSGHDHSSPAARVARSGYGAYRVIGENIAAGAMSPAQVVSGWLGSPAHCENIMDSSFREIGIAYAVNRQSDELVFWTQDFAAR